jgi:hypothetical protein
MTTIKWVKGSRIPEIVSKTDLYEPGTKHLYMKWNIPEDRYCAGYFRCTSTHYGTNELTIHHELHFWYFSIVFVRAIKTETIFQD